MLNLQKQYPPKFVINGHVYSATCADCDKRALIYSSTRGGFQCPDHFRTPAKKARRDR